MISPNGIYPNKWWLVPLLMNYEYVISWNINKNYKAKPLLYWDLSYSENLNNILQPAYFWTKFVKLRRYFMLHLLSSEWTIIYYFLQSFCLSYHFFSSSSMARLYYYSVVYFVEDGIVYDLWFHKMF